MCLDNLTTNIALTAKRDIVCWKSLDVKHKRNGEEVYYSPYMYSRYKLGKLRKANMAIGTSCSPIAIYVGLHTFAYKKDANRNYTTFKAIIPKGSKYWIGKFGNKKGYASNQLIVLKPKKRKQKRK